MYMLHSVEIVCLSKLMDYISLMSLGVIVSFDFIKCDPHLWFLKEASKWDLSSMTFSHVDPPPWVTLRTQVGTLVVPHFNLT